MALRNRKNAVSLSFASFFCSCAISVCFEFRSWLFCCRVFGILCDNVWPVIFVLSLAYKSLSIYSFINAVAFVKSSTKFLLYFSVLHFNISVVN